MQEVERTIGKKARGTFFSIVIGLSAVLETLICLGGPDWLMLALMWTPALGATVANCIAMQESGEGFDLKKLFAYGGFRKCKLRYIALGWMLPAVYLLIPYLIYWGMYPENFAYHGVALGLILKDCLPVAVLGTFISLLSAMGEEIGWRGFMVPALFEKFGLNKMLCISGLVWCGWHLPLLMFGDYMSGTSLWFQVPAFVLCIFPVGVMTALLTLMSGSVWPAAFLHAAHNNYDQMILGVVTAGATKMYFVSETGIFTIVCGWVLAAVLYKYYKKKCIS